jgi:hypothetical protein
LPHGPEKRSHTEPCFCPIKSRPPKTFYESRISQRSTGTIKLRDIFEEPLFSEQLDRLAVSFRRRDEILEAVGFALARHPEIFPKIPGTSLSAITVILYNNTPPVFFLFVYNEDRVTLVGVEFGVGGDAKATTP